MSEPENFLARWSRRKQEAEHTAEKPNDPPREDGEIAAELSSDLPVGDASEEKKEPEFDLSTLPPIDSIGAGTDIRAFLQKGVPMELSRAALRRAWTSDPAIRDFIEVAENQWDFATGSDLPGFGPLEPTDDVRRLVAEVFEGRSSAPSPVDSLSENNVQGLPERQNSQQPTQQALLQNPEPQNSQETSIETFVSEPEAVVHREAEISATQQDVPQSDSALPTRRTHGSALPR